MPLNGARLLSMLLLWEKCKATHRQAPDSEESLQDVSKSSKTDQNFINIGAVGAVYMLS